MPIHGLLMGLLDAYGHVILMCRDCNTPAEDAKTAETILKVCPQCGTPLGEWATETKRNAELRKWAKRIKRTARPE
jgi:ribosomal protein L34E